MMSYWKRNKEAAITRDDTPTLCDQSQAKDADINIIIKMLGKTGTAPGAAGEPIYGDFTQLPRDLRGFIEKGRELQRLQGALPPQLKGKPITELMELTYEDMQKILTPEPKETPKEKSE